MAQLCKAAMAARVGLGQLLDDFEDSRRPSSLSPRFRQVPVEWWMWRPAEVETIYSKHLGQKGDANRAQSGLGQSAQAGRLRPISARFGPGFLPSWFSRDPLFVCTCMWAFDVVSFTVKSWILAMQASLFSGWVPKDLHVDASVLGSFGVMFIACLDLWRASWSPLEVLDELIPNVSSLTLISCVNNKLQNRHASVNLLHH
jgi:hypothetical protein